MKNRPPSLDFARHHQPGPFIGVIDDNCVARTFVGLGGLAVIGPAVLFGNCFTYPLQLSLQSCVVLLFVASECFIGVHSAWYSLLVGEV